MSISVDEIKHIIQHYRNMAQGCIPNGEGQQAFNFCADRLELLIPKHDWQFYMNGTFCSRCNKQIGDQGNCV